MGFPRSGEDLLLGVWRIQFTKIAAGYKIGEWISSIHCFFWGSTRLGIFKPNEIDETTRTQLYFFIIGIQSLQSWTVNVKHRVTRKRKSQTTGTHRKVDQKELRDKRYFLTLELKPFRWWIKWKHGLDKDFQGLAVRETELSTRASL